MSPIMEKVTLNKKEQKRSVVMNEILAGRMTGQEAADVLGLSLRQVRRLLARWRDRLRSARVAARRGRSDLHMLKRAP